MFSGWLAGSPGAARDFANARIFDVEIVPKGGTTPVFELGPKSAKNYWTFMPGTDEEIAGWIGVSPNMMAQVTFAQWLVPVGQLPAGEYEVHAAFGTRHKITDLGDYYLRNGEEGSDHKPDLYPTWILTGTNTIDLTVAE